MNSQLFLFLFLILRSKVGGISVKTGNELPPADKLDKNAITELINDAGAQAKWGYILKRNILYTDKYRALKSHTDRSAGEIKYLNVHEIIEKYVNTDAMDEHVSLDDIRGLIRDATGCAGLTYTDLFATMVLRDLMPFVKVSHDMHDRSERLSQDTIDAINRRINEECENPTEIRSDGEDENNERTDNNRADITTASVLDEYRMNFNIFTGKRRLEFRGMSKLQGSSKLEMDTTWKNIVRKRATLDIEYRIDPEQLNSICNPVGTVEPFVVDLYEIIWVLVSTVRNTSEKLQRNCVAHNGSFVKKYQSISNELGEDFARFIEHLDEHKDIVCNLLKDFLISIKDPFRIRRANFKDENTTEVSLDITYGGEPEENSRYKNATYRKLSFSTSFENDFDDEDFEGDERTNKVSGTKQPEVYYYFKGTVNVSLS